MWDAAVIALLAASVECGAPGPAATSPCTVPLGHVQIEGDIASVSFDRSEDVERRAAVVGPLVFKVPVTQRVQLETSLVLYQIARLQPNGAAAVRDGAGPDALTVKLKINMISGERVSLALHPGVRFSLTSNRAQGTELTFGTPVALTLPRLWSLTLNPQIGVGTGNGRARLQNLVALSRPVSRQWIIVTELSTTFEARASRPWQHLMILGGDYTPRAHPDLHIDIGIGIGLNERAPDRLVYLGFSKRL